MTSRARILIAALRAFVVVFGTAALWLSRDAMSPDGVAYLDASDVYLSGGWPAAGTGYWSPLYPTLLAGARLVAGQGAARELLIAQGVNLLLFLCTFTALEYLVREVRWTTRARFPGAPPNDTAWQVLVYAFFGVLTVGWIRVWTLTPDMAVAAIVFAIAAVCIRLTTGRGRWPSVVVLGLLLGLGYLAKAVLLPIGVFTLATLAVLLRRRPGDLTQIALAALIFLGIAAPQIAYTSRLKGSPTIGDVGRLNYLWFVADVPGPVSSAFPLPARLPSPTATGQTLTRLDAARGSHPAVYDIDAPIPGTLPIWYDAGYWYRGVVAPVRPGAIARALVRHARVYLELFGFLLVGGAAAALAGPVSRRLLLAMRPAPVLIVPDDTLCAIARVAPTTDITTIAPMVNHCRVRTALPDPWIVAIVRLLFIEMTVGSTRNRAAGAKRPLPQSEQLCSWCGRSQRAGGAVIDLEKPEGSRSRSCHGRACGSSAGGSYASVASRVYSNRLDRTGCDSLRHLSRVPAL